MSLDRPHLREAPLAHLPHDGSSIGNLGLRLAMEASLGKTISRGGFGVRCSEATTKRFKKLAPTRAKEGRNES